VVKPDARRIVVLAVPVAVNLVMPVVYRRLARALGAQRGYVAGFAVYWSACVAIPVAVLGGYPADLAEGAGQGSLLLGRVAPPVVWVGHQLGGRHFGVADDPVAPGDVRRHLSPRPCIVARTE
jgi:hypothetical protein